MWYYNHETGKKESDHPLDDHYRQMFLRAKAEKQGQLGTNTGTVGGNSGNPDSSTNQFHVSETQQPRKTMP